MNDDERGTAMKSIRHVLVATDFGPASERAIDTAIGLAEAAGAKITLLHVIDAPYPYPVPLPVEMKVEARQALEKLAAVHRTPKVEIATAMREGESWRQIIAAAEELHADLIVVGSHNRRGVPRILLGSVAERVVRHAPVDVLTVRGPTD
jgi:nucleotide-binding universal stress UspA family protein